jgi:signal transduction histidine kinase
MAIEICARAWLSDLAERLAEEAPVAALPSVALQVPEDWFVHAALGMVLLGSVLMARWLRRRQPRPMHAGGDLFEAIFHALPYPAFCKDLHGAYLAVNRAYEDAFGVEAGQLLGRDLLWTRHLDLDCGRMHATHLSLIRTAASASQEVILASSRQGACAYRLRLMAMEPRADGAALLGVAIAMEPAQHPRPTARDGSAAALDYALLAAISHDLRTPLTGIIGTLELLGYSELTARQRALVGGAESASRSLQSILDDVLALAKLETGAASRERLPFDLRELLGGLAAQRPADLPLSLVVDERVAPLFIGDGDGLRQALEKLLAHALSRGLDASAQLQLRVLAQGAQWQSIELELSACSSRPAAEALHGDELAWIAACKLCESMDFTLQEQGGTAAEPRFVVRGRMMVAAGTVLPPEPGAADPGELASQAHEDARQVIRRLAEVFGEDACARTDYLQLIRNEEQRLQANLDGSDVPRLREVAHYLCGMGSFFGAQRLSGMAISTELGDGADEVLRHARTLRSYLTGFIDSLDRITCDDSANAKDTKAISDKSHRNASDAALER